MFRTLHTTALFVLASALSAQYLPPDPSGMQGVIVERYYVADANDAADTDGGPGLLEGAVTYRVFIDLKPGYKLLTVGGFENHPITMGTTTTFFNNEDRGAAWGYSINDIHLDVNTTAIDSWLTIGASSDAHWGVLKTADTDGSIVGGANNDGGSNGVPEGLLVNVDATAGIALTTADGLSAGVVPTVNAVGAGPDLFEPGGASSYTNANYAWAVLGGTEAPDTTNRILVGQFTTDGVLDLCLNFFVKIPEELVCDDPACHEFLIFYADLLPADTAGTSIANDNLFTHPTLCYTSTQLVADCEGVIGGSALPGTPCDDGNVDTTNDLYESDCDCSGEDCEGTPGGTALPGTPCDDGNPDTSSDTWTSSCICEGFSAIEEADGLDISIAPNPVRDVLRVSAGSSGVTTTYELIDALGARVAAGSLMLNSNGASTVVDMSRLPQGLYFLHVRAADAQRIVRVVKL